MSCSFLTTLFWWSISSSNFLKSDTWKIHFEILSFLACLIESLAGYEIIAWKLFSLQTSDIIPLSSYFWYCYWKVWYHSDFVCDLFPPRAFFFIPRTLQYHDDMVACVCGPGSTAIRGTDIAGSLLTVLLCCGIFAFFSAGLWWELYNIMMICFVVGHFYLLCSPFVALIQSENSHPSGKFSCINSLIISWTILSILSPRN